MTDSSEDGWPSYAYVPGQGPHPRRSPRGHSFGLPEPSAQASPDERFWRNAAYRRGVALYDRGFYWEAHEAWEALWHAYGRRGPVATLLQALIQLAAAQVKIRQAMPRGVASLSGRAIAALRDLERQASLPS
ncbi:MAG: DUF309 domain-containing protein, partial [Planctomycetes bacterium]|nr:DUF309 domain-containing protein [Planctomycetota bacterium]